MAKQPIRLSDHSACQCIQRARAAGRNLLIGKGLPFPIIITTTKVVVCTDPRRVITGLAPKGASKVWHRITLTGRR